MSIPSLPLLAAGRQRIRGAPCAGQGSRLAASRQGLLVTVVSVLLFTRGLMPIGAERVSLVTALVTGVAGALTAPLLGETVGLLDAAGPVVVVVAVVLGSWRPHAL